MAKFLTYAGKVNLNYVLPGGHRFYANAGYFNDAPTFSQSFMSPRTRNQLAPELTTVKTLTGDTSATRSTLPAPTSRWVTKWSSAAN